jgi:hypothetical protein
MSDEAQRQDALYEAIEAALEGRLAAADMAALERLLKEDEAARRTYVRAMLAHAALERSGVPSDADDARPLPRCTLPAQIAPAPRFPRNLLYLTGDTPVAAALLWLVMVACAGMVAMVILLAFFAFRGMHVTIERPEVAKTTAPVEDKPRPPAPVVAHVGRAVDCRWEDAEAAVAPGDELAAGSTLRLRRGIVEVVFGHGAKVLLQGPADLEMVSISDAFLHRGTLTARVESAEAKGFELHTPGMKFVDLGTEFGVKVRENGVQEVHVFRGKVEASGQWSRTSGQWPVAGGQSEQVARPASGSPATQHAPPVTLVAHEAIRVVSPDKPLERITAAPHEFVREGKFARLLDQQGPAFVRWQAARDKLCRRDDLVAYYDFQADDADPAVLRNRAASGSRYDGRIEGGAAWVAGRFAGKQALAFAQRTAEVRINIPLESQELTLAAWALVEPSPAGVGENVLLMSNSWGQPAGSTCWEIHHTLGRLNVDLNGKNQLLSPLVFTIDGHNGWRFVAVTGSSPGKLRHYLDGRVIAEQEMQQGPGRFIGPATIGNWEDLGAQGGARRPFGGAIEQMMIFRKALSSGQIAALYEATK